MWSIISKSDATHTYFQDVTQYFPWFTFQSSAVGLLKRAWWRSIIWKHFAVVRTQSRQADHFIYLHQMVHLLTKSLGKRRMNQMAECRLKSCWQWGWYVVGTSMPNCVSNPTNSANSSQPSAVGRAMPSEQQTPTSKGYYNCCFGK